jgi:hypothetical protein
LITELRNEKFTFGEINDPSSPYRKSALYEVSAVACKEEWQIYWTAHEGTITEIGGMNRDICL